MLLVVFIATAAVVPLLISPDRTPKRADAPTSSVASAGTPAVTGSTTPTPTSTPTPTPSPTPTPTPKPTAAKFLLSPPVKPRPVNDDPPRRDYREFESSCTPVRQSTKPPLTGAAPAGVNYLMFGSTAGKPAAPGRVPSGTTSCLAEGDRSSYWAPALYLGKQVIRPDDMTVLYKSEVNDYTSVQPFPAGLRMIVGGPGAGFSTPDDGAVSWACGDYNQAALPKSCPPDHNLTLRLSAPGCWDGRHLDVAGHRGHLAWAVNGRCPPDHPVAIPALLMRIIYPLDGSGSLHLDSGDGSTFGFGFISGWQPSSFAKLIKTCINAGRQCDTYGKS